MKCLDPLKTTGGLVRGFDEFLSQWLIDAEPNEESILLTDTEQTILARLPAEVREFYEVVQRWPTANIACENNQDAFITPPRFHRRWKKSEWIEDTRFASLGMENQGNWEVVIAIDGDDTGRLFTDMDDEGSYPGTWMPMNSKPDEFLVTLGFHELILCADHQLSSESNPLEGATLIYTGRYQGDYIQKVFGREDGTLWLTNDGEQPWWVCARPSTDKPNNKGCC